uniref:Uncharacterized protein LOC116937073 isoform X4 n=1 Tax=Petromyzon marinus TaxID=7757 RepID=A0AAJ7SK02_PETMA|nr:uncharacterized protein LOC116937073 isoform X4 [Petromyzon marinus]
MSTVCKHRHRGDKGGRAWCEPPHPHPRIGGRGRHRKLPALANNSGRTRTPRWWRVDLHDRRRRMEPPAHRLLPERVREGQRSWGLHPAVARRVWWELNTSGAIRLPGTARRSWRSPGQLAWLQCNTNSQGRNRFVCGRLRFQTVFLFCEDVDDGLVPDPHSPPRTTRAAHEPRVE